MIPVELQAYLRRIGLPAPAAPTRTALAALLAAHTRRIPFENLDPWLGREVALDLPALCRKLVDGGRGGYCYEHNLLLDAALGALGWKTTRLAARVLWNQPPGVERPRTHMLLSVEDGGEALLVDAGFGGMTLTAPLVMDTAAPQATPHGTFRLVASGGERLLQADVGGQWRTLYAFDLQPQALADYALASWYLGHHPESMFRTTLMAACVVEDGRHALRDNRWTFHPLRGSSTTRTLSDGAQLHALLGERFGIDTSALPGLRERLDRVAAGGDAAA